MLKAFLARPGHPPGTLSYHELQGFLFAVVAAPDVVPPSEWLRIVFGDHDVPAPESPEEAERLMTALMGLYNELAGQIAGGSPDLPADCGFRDPVLANLDEDAPVSHWCRGFIQGHQWMEESWDPYIPEDLDQEVGFVLMALSFFAKRELAEEFVRETGRKDLEELATLIRGVFAEALREYARLGRSIHHALAEEERRARRH